MTQLLVIAFRKQFAGKAYLKIILLVKTPLHRRSTEVRRSGLWAPGPPERKKIIGTNSILARGKSHMVPTDPLLTV